MAHLLHAVKTTVFKTTVSAKNRSHDAEFDQAKINLLATLKQTDRLRSVVMAFATGAANLCKLNLNVSHRIQRFLAKNGVKDLAFVHMVNTMWNGIDEFFMQFAEDSALVSLDETLAVISWSLSSKMSFCFTLGSLTIILQFMEGLKKSQKEREELRTQFDYYRNKVNKLTDKGAKEKEHLDRNNRKLENAEEM